MTTILQRHDDLTNSCRLLKCCYYSWKFCIQ